MKILAIIPARGGSKGIPRKNIKLLDSKPLLAYTIERALQSKLLDTIMVSTEDSEIAEVASLYGLPVPFMRPEYLALDNTPSIDVIQNVLKTYIKQDIYFDAVMLLEPTSPFREYSEIDEFIRLFIEKDSDSLISVKKVPDNFNPYWVFKDDTSSQMLKPVINEPIIPRRQNLPMTFVRDGSIYLTKTDVITKQNSLFGTSIAYNITKNPFQVNIDTMEDWNEAERILQLKSDNVIDQIISNRKINDGLLHNLKYRDAFGNFNTIRGTIPH